MSKSDRILELPDSELIRRLTYWELLEFTRLCPLRFNGAHLENLTIQQRKELNKYLAPGRDVWHLWPEESSKGFRPFPVTRIEWPFQDTKGTILIGQIDTGIPPENTKDAASAHVASAAAPAISDHLGSVESRQLNIEPVDKQQIVLSAPPDISQIVLAPPGTGKTHVLIQRLCRLLSMGAVTNPAAEILVLCFSRAAVSEIVRRLRAEAVLRHDHNLRYIQVRTFDSFATRSLTRGDREATLATGYEARIRQFCSSIAADTLPDICREELTSLRFLAVDEVQDLVGDRARMTMALIRFVHSRGGAVLLCGDPAQGIYDWQLDDRDPDDSARFLTQAREILTAGANRFQETELTEYRRFKNTELLSLVQRCRAAVGQDGSKPDITQLTNQLQELPSLPIQQLGATVALSERTAILTRTNLEAYQISEWLRQQDVAHRVERGSTGRYWPGWIARLCFGYKMDRMPLTTARKRWEKLVENKEQAGFDAAIEYLQRHGCAEDDALEMNALSDLIEKGQPECCWPPSENSGLTVSTIHRSKGLEFDSVVLLKAEQGRFNAGDDDGGQGEARILYVAATRAQRSLKILLRDHKVLRKGNKHCFRFPKAKLHRFHVFDHATSANFLLLDGLDELDMGDVRRMGNGMMRGDVQEQIWDECRGLSSLLRARRVDGDFYWLLSSGASLCRLDSQLVYSLTKLAKVFRSSEKKALGLTEVPVVDVATVSFAWEGGDDVEDHLGKARLSLAPVIYGLGRVDLAE